MIGPHYLMTELELGQSERDLRVHSVGARNVQVARNACGVTVARLFTDAGPIVAPAAHTWRPQDPPQPVDDRRTMPDEALAVGDGARPITLRGGPSGRARPGGETAPPRLRYGDSLNRWARHRYYRREVGAEVGCSRIGPSHSLSLC